MYQERGWAKPNVCNRWRGTCTIPIYQVLLCLVIFFLPTLCGVMLSVFVIFFLSTLCGVMLSVFVCNEVWTLGVWDALKDSLTHCPSSQGWAPVCVCVCVCVWCLVVCVYYFRWRVCVWWFVGGWVLSLL